MNLHHPKLLWVLRILVAGILLQTLFFKFSAAPESVWIFTEVSTWLTGDGGLATPMRIGSGIAELVAAVLLLIPRRRTAGLGSALALGTISGAIFFHLTALGLIVHDDGGALFAMAIAVFAGSTWVLSATWRNLLPVHPATDPVA